MAIDTSDLKDIFNMFADELKILATKIQKETNMEDEHFSSIVSEGLVGAMASSVRALEVYKRNELTDKQMDISEAEKQRVIALKDDVLSRIQTENDLRPKKVLSAELDNNIKNYRLSTALPKQDKKLEADTNFVKEQQAQLIENSDANKKIRTLDSFTRLFGTLGAGSNIVPDKGWTFISDIGNDLTGKTLNSEGFQRGIISLDDN